ncbi:MAG TPA: hypothetical protein VNL77_24930 [Roseiflexaceae bacterium]|nr:hypothetical protein [Roseiflexaceae bacterium]
MHRRHLLKLLAAVPLAACTAAPRAAPPTPARPTPGPRPGLYVDAGYEYGPISPLVYGTNTGPWQTVGLEQIPLSKAAGISAIRWPGGNWGDENDVTERQLEEFIALCRQIGAEPIVHVRLFGGSPERAAALVRTANVQRRYGVRYWAVGNEPDLYVTKRGAASYTAADYARDFQAYRAAMKVMDASIVVMGPEISQYSDATSYPVDATGVPWMEGFLRAVPDVEQVSFHRYPFGDPPATPETLAAEPPAWTRAMESLRAQIRRATGRDIPIAVTEANSDWTGRTDPQAGTDSHRNALWWADVLGRLIRAQATIVAQFCMGAIPSQGIGMFGPLAYDPGPRPIYQVYALYRMFGTRLVHASSDDDRLPLTAARREDGTLTLVVVNHADEPRSAALSLNGLRPAGPAEVWSFADGHPMERRGTADLARPIPFEARSATLMVVGGTADRKRING